MNQRPTTYKYQLHQIVRLLRAPIATKGMVAPSEYEIVRLMPADANGEISYRIKAGAAELAVREHEITI